MLGVAEGTILSPLNPLNPSVTPTERLQHIQQLGAEYGQTLAQTEEEFGVAGAVGHATFDFAATALGARGATGIRPGPELPNPVTTGRIGDLRPPGLLERLSDEARRGLDVLRDPDVELQQQRRRSAEFQARNPELLDEVARVRRAAEELDLPNLDRAGLADFIRSQQELAGRLDAVSATQRPSGVGVRVLEGRQPILQFLERHLEEGGDLRTVRSLTEGALFNSDLSVRPTLNRLRPGSQVLRAFGGEVSAAGSYFGRVVDQRFTVDEHRRFSALPRANEATEGLSIDIEQESFALVSRVGPQNSDFFHPDSVGGTVQLQFLQDPSIYERLRSLRDNPDVIPQGLQPFTIPEQRVAPSPSEFTPVPF
ncbi:MAG TPA: hypothetical protein EYO33_26895 [Phycisphaerales bacterium]|nr:hypothetical protein [Phycisphaerales bacterium]